MALIFPINSGIKIDNRFWPTFESPLDPRCVVDKYEYLYNDEFIALHPYVGMVSVVVNDGDNNGAYYYTFNRTWEPISGTSHVEFTWPDPPEDYDPTKNYYLRFEKNPTTQETEPVWEEVSIEEGQTFTFTTSSPYIENDNGYSIGSNLQSSEEMTLNNQYMYDNEHKTADVVSVKDSDTSFHLMLNPDLNYVLYGGDSEGVLQVQLTVESLIEKGRWEIQTIAPIGLSWFISSGLYNTDPSDAIVHWYPSLQDAIDRQNEITNINDPIYNYLDENGETFTFGAVATKNGYRDSMEREITISIIDDSIDIDVFINDVTRTTARIEN